MTTEVASSDGAQARGLPGGVGAVRDLLTFRRFITPAAATLIWAIGAVVLMVGGLASITANPEMNLVAGIAGVLVINLLWRVVVELLVVLFRIEAALRRG